jgi:hypothetical protein
MRGANHSEIFVTRLQLSKKSRRNGSNASASVYILLF